MTEPPQEEATAQAPPRRRRSLLGRLGLLAAGGLAGLVLVEIGLRLFGVHFGPAHLLRDSQRGWRHRPGARLGDHTIDSRGYTGREVALPKPAGEFRVVCMGDSCTFGENVPLAQTYPARLEKLLKQRMAGRAVRVVNAGVNGYSSFQGLQWFKEDAANLGADVVTVFYGWNDHWLARIAGPDKDMAGSKVDRLRAVLSRLRVFELAVAAWHAARKTANMPFLDEHAPKPTDAKPAPAPPQPSRPLRVSLADYEANLRAFVALGRKKGARMVLLTAPNYLALAKRDALPKSALAVTDRGSVQELCALHESYNAVVRQVAASEKVVLVDLCKAFREAGDPAKLFASPATDFIHPSAAGHKVIADALAKAIAPK